MSNLAEEQKTDDAVTQWVTFSLGDETYGIDVMKVQEVLRFTEIAPVPGAPSYVLGIVNLRGNVVTVMDARQRFGLAPKESDEASRIVIVESGGLVAGLLVDAVAEVVEIRESESEAAPGVGAEESGRYIQGVCSRDDQLVILVELDRLLEGENVAEYAA